MTEREAEAAAAAAAAAAYEEEEAEGTKKRPAGGTAPAPAPAPKKPVIEAATNTCFKCDRVGHFARDCPGAAAEATAPSDGPPTKDCPTCVGATCLVRTSNSVRNPGRQYYKCDGCNYFAWCDEATKNVPAASRQIDEQLCHNCNKPGHWARDCPNASASPAQGGGRGARGDEGPAHTCPSCVGVTCLVRTSQSERNPGRQFFKCDGCNYFKWCDDVAASSARPAAGAAAGSSDQVCYKCNQTGHWARDCPNANQSSPSRRGSGSGGGGIAAASSSSGKCFKCGGEGHWSRDCPKAASSSMYSKSGGGSSSASTYGKKASGSCFKCGGEGHWSSNCPQGGRRY